MDRDELKIKVRDAIWNLDSQATLTGHWEDPSTYAESALTAIEEAGYVINEQKWRDIASAPKDGTAVLLYGRHVVDAPPGASRQVKAGDHWWSIALFDVWRPPEDGGRCWVFAKDGQHTWSDPTHWLPLPSPPETSDV